MHVTDIFFKASLQNWLYELISNDSNADMTNHKMKILYVCKR